MNACFVQSDFPHRDSSLARRVGKACGRERVRRCAHHSISAHPEMMIGGHGAKIAPLPTLRSTAGPREQRYRHSTLVISYAFAPPGATTSTDVPFFFPISARASGEVMEMRPF